MQGQTENIALVHAIERGDVSRVNRFISAGANVNFVRHDGTTPLTAAVGNGYTSVVKDLLRHGCDLNLQPAIIIRSKTIKTDAAIHIAAIKGNINILQLLLDADADVNLPGSSGNTALSKAAFHGKLDSVKMLVKAGALVNAKEHHQMSPLHWAGLSGHNDIVSFLLENKADINAKNVNKETALVLCTGKGHDLVVKTLLNTKYECDVDVITTIGRTIEVMTGHTALHAASRDGRVTIVRHLLIAGAKVDIKDGTQRTPLMWASKVGHIEVVELLIQSNCQVNFRNSLGQSSLYEATHGSHVHIVELLLLKGANPNIATTSGKTPLLRAVSLNSAALVRLILQVNCDVNQAGPRNIKPFHLAAGYGYIDLLQMLVIAGCDVTDINKWVAHNSMPYKLAIYPHIVLFLLATANNPPTLKHICANYIRSRLGIGLVNQVATLDIPTAMKSLLCLKELDQYVQNPLHLT